VIHPERREAKARAGQGPDAGFFSSHFVSLCLTLSHFVNKLVNIVNILRRKHLPALSQHFVYAVNN
jgi:hypothetical protein